MFDPRELLNTLIHGIASPIRQGASAVAGAAGQTGTMFSGVVAQAQLGLQGTPAASLLNHAASFAGQDPVATTAIIAGMAATLLGTHAGRKLAHEALELGGIATISGLARKAFFNDAEGLPPESSAEGSIPTPYTTCPFYKVAQDPAAVDVLLRAMIATTSAGNASGKAQRCLIITRMREAGLPPAECEYLQKHMTHPDTAESLAQAAQAVHAPQLLGMTYAAARLVARPDSDTEQTFLADLADALDLAPSLVQHIDAAVVGRE
jgi:uncharacterized membrane protein YebE (DUF533 family)